jgi:hypothetical protein
MAITELRRVQAERLPFYAGEWFDGRDPYDCNTAACAAGWLCRSKWMQAEGLEIDYSGFPLYEGSRGFEALALFFEVEIEDGQYAANDAIIGRVFSGEDYASPSVAWMPPPVMPYVGHVTAGMVADRMQQILEQEMADAR